MLDDFFIRALLAATGVAIVAGPFGCFIVWRRLSYFGDTLAHAGLLGVALSFLMTWNVVLSVFVVCAGVALLLIALESRARLSSDAVLGLLSHSALALGLVVLAFLTSVRIDLNALLFGDVLSVSVADISVIYGGGALLLALLAWLWRPLFASTLNRELAVAEGIDAARLELVFMLALALLIAVAMKVVGVLLITAMLIIPAAAARRFAMSPEQMAVLAAIIGAMAAIGGLFGSLNWDTPAGPSIVVTGLILFLLSLALPRDLAGGK